ncbi:uncharacterized protein [Dermacentor albipictus]|uniref:uncharacterized protein n=1 Tax=Dermacentor albipictus TaxID=60249 RepID=UPI0038FCB790
MECSTVPQDITGVLRGRCKECECNGFQRLVDLVGHEKVPIGWCILCGHSPVSHGALVNLYEGAQEGKYYSSVRRKPDLAVHHNSLLVDKYVISGQETPQLTQKKAQSKSVRHWNKTCLPKFSAYLRPLLEGENMPSKTRQRMTAQMRDDVIAFIDENHLIESSNSAIRRWEYRAFCEALYEAYPNMQWETERARKVQKLDCELGWSTFMRSVSTTRKTRKLRMKKRQELSSVSADNDPDRPALSSADAECELKTIRDAISDPANLDVSRIKVLLEATLEARRKSPENELPVYFLNPDVLALEAELRFEASFEDMLAKLQHICKMLGRKSFIEIDEYLRPKKAEVALISLETHERGVPIPGPCIIAQDGHKVVCKGHTIDLAAGSSLEHALIICITLYFILDITYPNAFGQTLGLVQTALAKREPFPRCLMSHKLTLCLKQLKHPARTR